MNRRLPLILLIFVLSAMMLMTACTSKQDSAGDSNSGKKTETVKNNDSGTQDGSAVFGDITITYPKGWSVESQTNDKILFSKTENNLPFFYVENNGWVGSLDTFMDNEMTSFSKKYQERVEMQPQSAGYTENGKTLKGYTAKYSSEDGKSSVTRYEFAEVINDVTYLYVCEYISGGYGDVKEDQTTYFEFMDAVGSIKAI